MYGGRWIKLRAHDWNDEYFHAWYRRSSYCDFCFYVVLFHSNVNSNGTFTFIPLYIIPLFNSDCCQSTLIILHFLRIVHKYVSATKSSLYSECSTALISKPHNYLPYIDVKGLKRYLMVWILQSANVIWPMAHSANQLIAT